MKKTLIVLLISMLCAFCSKNESYGFRIYNLSGYDLTINTPEGSYIVSTTRSAFFMSKESNENSFGYVFSDELMKPKIYSLNTSPERHINVDCYKYDFNVKVIGDSDSVFIRINGKYFHEPIPFEWGCNDHSILSYEIYSNPDLKPGRTFTQVQVNGFTIDVCDHINGENCKLEGKIIY